MVDRIRWDNTVSYLPFHTNYFFCLLIFIYFESFNGDANTLLQPVDINPLVHIVQYIGPLTKNFNFGMDFQKNFLRVGRRKEPILTHHEELRKKKEFLQ